MTNFIQGLHLKKGALHKQLGIPDHKKIPLELLRGLKDAQAGATLINPTSIGKRKLKVSRLLEERAIFALTLSKLRKKRRY